MASLKGLNFFRNVYKYTPLIAKPTQIRCISTSQKKRDTATVASEVHDNAACEAKVQKNWMSYGFSHEDITEDRLFAHLTMFFGISIAFCLGGFIFVYRPDDVGRDWAQREAYLELRRREKLGLPLIEHNYIPEDKVMLPTDEELGDTEIII